VDILSTEETNRPGFLNPDAARSHKSSSLPVVSRPVSIESGSDPDGRQLRGAKGGARRPVCTVWNQAQKASALHRGHSRTRGRSRRAPPANALVSPSPKTESLSTPSATPIARQRFLRVLHQTLRRPAASAVRTPVIRRGEGGRGGRCRAAVAGLSLRMAQAEHEQVGTLGGRRRREVRTTRLHRGGSAADNLECNASSTVKVATAISA